MQTARKLGEFNFTHVYTGEPGKWPLITQVAMHSAVLGMCTLLPREKKKVPKRTFKNLCLYNTTQSFLLQ